MKTRAPGAAIPHATGSATVLGASRIEAASRDTPLPILLLFIALAVSACGTTSWQAEGSSMAQISFGLPLHWKVDNGTVLQRLGIVPGPVPFALVASEKGSPSALALHASSVPWAVALVEDMQTGLSPAKLYQVIPEDLKQAGELDNSPVTDFKTLEQARPIEQGGLEGSSAGYTAVSRSGSTSFLEVDYTDKAQSRIWLVVAGCAAACYHFQSSSLRQIIASTRVGAAVAKVP
jgi:hypothetical protein